jgi:hypothetical protein
VAYLGVLVQRPVTATHVDKSKDELVRHLINMCQSKDSSNSDRFYTYVVDDEHRPAYTLISHAQMHFVKYDDINQVHGDGTKEQVSAEVRPHDEGDGKDKRREEIQKGLVDLRVV